MIQESWLRILAFRLVIVTVLTSYVMKKTSTAVINHGYSDTSVHNCPCICLFEIFIPSYGTESIASVFFNSP